ncbi:hypothetical protein BY996DRAFT_6476559 [Phakopsora pachyrhizi]|nr:hypothetical protein BY996DRAFT_6476559 [Phakopsora pachyrhizi]
MPGAKQLEQLVAASELALKAAANLACDIARAFHETFRSLIPDYIGLADRILPLPDALKSWEKSLGQLKTEVQRKEDRAAVVGDDEGQVEVDELLASAAEIGDADGPELAGELCGVGFERMRIDGQDDMGLEIWKPVGWFAAKPVDTEGDKLCWCESLFLPLVGSLLRSNRITGDCGMGMTPTRLGFRGEMKLGALDDPGSSLEEAGIDLKKVWMLVDLGLS